jgi:hypothetical protein
MCRIEQNARISAFSTPADQLTAAPLTSEQREEQLFQEAVSIEDSVLAGHAPGRLPTGVSRPAGREPINQDEFAAWCLEPKPAKKK